MGSARGQWEHGRCITCGDYVDDSGFCVSIDAIDGNHDSGHDMCTDCRHGVGVDGEQCAKCDGYGCLLTGPGPFTVCLLCSEKARDCECTGGPLLEPECTCYEPELGHGPGCYFNAIKRAD